MKTLSCVTLAAALVLACTSQAMGDLVLDGIAGPGALESHYSRNPFWPPVSQPRLTITGEVFHIPPLGGSAALGIDVYTLDLHLTDGFSDTGTRVFDNLMLTAAFRPEDTTFDRMRFFDLDNPGTFVDIAYGAFVDASLLGLPTGGAEPALGFDGAFAAGVDLGVGLDNVPAGSPQAKVSVGVQVIGAEPGSKLRFDGFGLDPQGSHGWVTRGHTGAPYSGPSDGEFGPGPTPSQAVPEPATATLILIGAAGLTAWRRRRNRK